MTLSRLLKLRDGIKQKSTSNGNAFEITASRKAENIAIF
jgi:hypothetical protein